MALNYIFFTVNWRVQNKLPRCAYVKNLTERLFLHIAEMHSLAVFNVLLY